MLQSRVLSLIALVAVCPGYASDDAVEAARSYRETNGPAILRDYADLLALRNTPEDPTNLERNAEEIRKRLAERGVSAELLRLDGAAPLVYGRKMVPGARRTLGVYVHYDGQPVDPAQWTHPPFEPTLYTAAIEAGGEPREFPASGEVIDPEWRIYARSAGDDKVPIGGLLAAFDALAAAKLPLTSNLVFLFEGEEEQGSTNLEQFLTTYRDRFDVDLWLICDGPVHQSRRPQLVFGVRGYTGIEITVYGAERYLHSGHYGNWAPNPAQGLASLLAGMKDDEGRVLIEGYYDSVKPLGEADREALDQLPAIDDALRSELGLARSEAGNASLAERLLLPSLNVRGLSSATVGATARNVIPATATASIDIRLVEGNHPEGMLDLVETYIRSRGYHVVRDAPDHATRLAHPRIARVVRNPGYPAVRTPVDLPVLQPVIRAAELAAGEPLVLLPSLGGSLPLYLFAELLEQPLVVVPVANHDDNQHAPDENLRIANLWYGIDLYSALFTMPQEPGK